MNSLEQKSYVFSPHAAVGGVEDAGVHDDDGTRRTWMNRLKWQRGMCQERTCTAMPAGGSTHTLPEGCAQEGKLARPCQSMYGTRDAASIW